MGAAFNAVMEEESKASLAQLYVDLLQKDDERRRLLERIYDLWDSDADLPYGLMEEVRKAMRP